MFNVSYNTTGNNTIMSHLGVNKNSKTNSNPKKRKIDQTMLYVCAKMFESKRGVKPKIKRKPDKNQKPKWKINIEKEIETMRREMLILSETERNKDPKRRKARKVIRIYKITNAIGIPSIK